MIKVLKEVGYTEALLGLGLSYNLTNVNNICDYQTSGRLHEVANKLADKGGGHNKFLESINVYMYVKAPRYIWQEFDTYRVGITKQSESTMHTLMKSTIDNNMFDDIELEENKEDFNIILQAVERIKNRDNLHDTKVALPEGFIQGRLVVANYKTIQNIYRQRKNHKMKWWRINLVDLLEQLEHSELIIK